MTIVDKDRRIAEDPDLVISGSRGAKKYKMDLIPPGVIVLMYFADKQAEVDQLTVEADAATAAVTEHAEGAAEDALLSEATNDKGAYTKALVKKVLDEAERRYRDSCLCAKATDLLNYESAAKKALKEKIDALNSEVLNKYGA